VIVLNSRTPWFDDDLTWMVVPRWRLLSVSYPTTVKRDKFLSMWTEQFAQKEVFAPNLEGILTAVTLS